MHTKDIQIPLNAKIVSVLKSIYDQIGEYEIISWERIPNNNMVESGVTLNPQTDSRTEEKAHLSVITKKNFEGSGIVNSLYLMDETGKYSSYGNFLSILEDFTICSCLIKVRDDDKKEKVKEKRRSYKDYNIKSISSIKSNQLSDKLFDDEIFFVDHHYDYLTVLGTYLYLHYDEPNEFDTVSDCLIKYQTAIMDNHTHENNEIKDFKRIDQKLLTCAIINYHIFRLIEDQDNRTTFYNKIKSEIENILSNWKCRKYEQKCDLKRIQIQHYGYCIILFDGENYNYKKGKEIAARHGLTSAISKIISRNMSHIEGSHIEHGLRNKMDTFEDCVKEAALFTKLADIMK